MRGVTGHRSACESVSRESGDDGGRNHVTIRVSVRVDRDARVGRFWTTDSETIEVPRNKLIVDDHTATTRNRNPIILSE